MKRFASHYVITVDGEHLKQYVVELENEEVVRYFPLLEETESTEWLPGVIELKKNGKHIVAYHLYPFDFILMKPVGETQRKQLK